MEKIIQITQLVSSLLLIAVILVQSRGAGLGGVFGGDSGVYRTKRGAEKFFFASTIVLAVIFLGLAVVNLFLAK